MISPDAPVSALPGIGPARAKAFARIGVERVEDLLYHIPRGYEDRGRILRLADVQDGENASFLLTVATVPRSARLRGNLSLTKFRAFDESGSAEMVYFNQDYLRDVFTVGTMFRFTGKVRVTRAGVQLSGAKYERFSPETPLPDYVPIYALSEGLTRPVVQKAVDAAARETLPFLPDFLPESVRSKYRLPTLGYALRALHFPEEKEDIRAGLRRLAFDEFFLFALGMRLSRQQIDTARAKPFRKPDSNAFFSLLPYCLTPAQKRVCAEMEADMCAPHPMNRILVGDVGCGKTVCAAYAVYTALFSGHQAAVMAPTEILARQHYEDLAPLFSALGYRTALLLGSSGAREKKAALAAINGQGEERADLVVGTHALLSDRVCFSDLALTVTDEQHRFGVFQRATLRRKCPEAHLLVMSATPIPRTLALMLYGDLAVSRIDEMPAGRQRVDTFTVDESYRDRLNAFIEKQVAAGGQVYVVCPAIAPPPREESAEEATGEEITLHSLLFPEKEPAPPKKYLTETAAALQTALPSLRIACLHGKMKTAEKECVMRAFAAGETDVLVSTTVIEVGVNVPNACLMIVESADCFGLAQLHQLRGRVGRGKRKSFCVLVSNAKSAAALARLDTMRKTYDGYTVAEEDLKQRGPGDFLSPADGDTIRQSGGLSFRFAALCDDTALSGEAAAEADALCEGNTALHSNEYAPLLAEVKKRFAQKANIIS